MKIGKPMSKAEEGFFYLFFLLVLCLEGYRYFTGADSLGSAVSMIAVCWASMVIINLKQIRNKNASLIEVNNEKLYYKTYFGTVKAYDLRKLKGKVESKGAYLMAPGLIDPENQVLDMSHLDDKIYLGYLKRKERRRFLEYLNDYVRSYEPAD